MSDKFQVDSDALRQVLVALNGPPHLIRELQVIRRLGNSPIDKLIKDFNASVEQFNFEVDQADSEEAEEAVAGGRDYKDEYGGGWIGVDFDGTLATYDGFKGPDVLGKPILPMVERVRGWLAEGKDVRIFTARASPFTPQGKEEYPSRAREALGAWCMEVFGCHLPLTNEKDYLMRELWDDRCVQVEFNTGIEVTDKLRNCENCSTGPKPCVKCYGSQPEETRCNPSKGQEFYMAQWSPQKAGE